MVGWTLFPFVFVCLWGADALYVCECVLGEQLVYFVQYLCGDVVCLPTGTRRRLLQHTGERFVIDNSHLPYPFLDILNNWFLVSLRC